MNISDSFLQEEIIEGFRVRAMMKRYWAAGLEILSQFDELCQANNIKYYVYYGTLLGALRHNGFIPWDDDIDIAMMRWDFDRLIEVMSDNQDKYFNLINVDVSSMYPPRIINTYYTNMDDDFLTRYHYCPYPVGMDIYVFDKVPTDRDEAEVLKWLHQNARFVAQRTDPRWQGGSQGYVNNELIDSVITQIEQATGYVFTRDDTLPIQMTRFLNCISATYNDTESDNVARIHNWAITGDNECIPTEWFGEGERLTFEGMSVPVPKRYREVLAKTMGEDYMTPINRSFGHNYPVYRRYEEKLFEIYKECGQEPPGFLFD